MNILMACEYFYPFDRGGSEWSVFYLARSLALAGHKVNIVTPNYGAKGEEDFFGFHIIRFPFYLKLKKKTIAQISPFWFTNLFWQCFSLFFLWKYVHRERADIVHLQGKYFIPAGFFLRVITGIPVIVTIRDYQIICPYGLCLVRRRRYTKCSFSELFNHDLKIYNCTYKRQSFFSFGIFQKVTAFRARLVSFILRFFANRLDSRIGISNKEKQILKKNGIDDVEVIYNIADFFYEEMTKVTKKRTVTFVGRLTPGKGVFLLLKAFRRLIKDDKNIRLSIIGEGIEQKKINQYMRDHNLTHRVLLHGHLSYRKTLQHIRKASLIVVPSIWEEPFGRVALEALSFGVPVVATDRGALPEIVEHGKTGYIVSPNELELSKAILKVLEKNLLLRKEIHLRRSSLKYKFFRQPIEQHIKLYSKLRK